jgi:pimeloyl-ACP methyl ester carboxylesterase
VFGGSWGSTLALAYAQTHPDKVTELVLRGIFMLRRWELEWFYQKGCDALYPDAWETYHRGDSAEVEHGDLMSAYHRRLTSSDAKHAIGCGARVVGVGRCHQFPVSGRLRLSAAVVKTNLRWPSRASNATTSSTAASSSMTISCYAMSIAFARFLR